MSTTKFCNWCVGIVFTLAGVVYAASCLFVAERASRFLWTSVGAPVCGLLARETSAPCFQVRLPFSGGNVFRLEIWREAQQAASTAFCDGTLIRGGIEIILFLLLLAIPMFTAYRFLVRPILKFQTIDPQAFLDLEKGDEEAGDVILNCMWSAPDSVMDEGEREEIEKILDSGEKANSARKILARREAKAKTRAVEIAKMAGLTIAASSSGIVDGLGMFFWRSKLVYDTFRIYGFRPGLRETASIYLHVVFASFFAASFEELSELLGVSGLFGGLFGRFLQAGVGIAMVIKGGYLTRAYLTKGISGKTRKTALEEFKDDSKGNLKEIMEELRDSLKENGLWGLNKLSKTKETENVPTESPIGA